jgi:hypothetical protein
MILAFALILSSLVSSASTAGCKPDILLDDFSNVRQGTVDEGAYAYMNLRGGGYGGANVKQTFYQARPNVPKSGKVTIVPSKPINKNWWFFKVEKNACFDLRGYKELRMEVRFPVGSSSKITLTQKSADCFSNSPGKILRGNILSRVNILNNTGAESDYIPISRYFTPNGKFQRLSIPLADFANRANRTHPLGSKYDFAHFKDFTFVEMTPGKVFEVYKITLIGNCA